MEGNERTKKQRSTTTNRTAIIGYGHVTSKMAMPTPCKPSYTPLTVEIWVGTVTVTALVDTGATACVISEAFEAKIPKERKKEQKIERLQLITACGYPMKKLKTVATGIKLHTVDHTPLENCFHVVPNLTIECILGMDFITRMEFRINTASRRISYKNDSKQFHLSATQSEIEQCQICLVSHQALEDEILKLIEKTEFGADELRNLLVGNQVIFATSDTDWGEAIGVEHNIPTVGPPVYIPPRRQPLVLVELIEKHVEMMKANGVIEDSCSNYSSPILIARKKDGSIRFCIDFRFVNFITTKDKFPIPSVETVRDYLKGAKYFSTLDFLSGYWQIKIAKKDRHKTAFTTRNGHYQFKRMAFGLTNAPPTFQRTMNGILRKVIGKYALVYLDDVIVFSKTIEDHIKHLENVFHLIRKSNMKLKLSKCEFLRRSVLYLGNIISEEGSRTDPSKIKVIKDYPIPPNVKELKSTLGLFGYYRKYIKNFGAIAHPLTELTKKETIFVWGPEQSKAFEILREKLMSTPILGHPDLTEEYIVHTDASGYAVGVVIGQQQCG